MSTCTCLFSVELQCQNSSSYIFSKSVWLYKLKICCEDKQGAISKVKVLIWYKYILQMNLPSVSQLVPVYIDEHWHVYPVGVFVQNPECWQGEDLQSARKKITSNEK